MTREEKGSVIEGLLAEITGYNNIYLADISDLNAEDTHKLRAACFKANVKISVVKNSLLQKAMETSDKDFEELYGVLKGNTSLMLSETGNAPAKVIKDIRKNSAKPILKGAWIESACYVGDDQLDSLVNIKSREELIGDIVSALQAPAKNVISALKSGGSTIAGLVKTLQERGE